LRPGRRERWVIAWLNFALDAPQLLFNGIS
jgi:hypothetical protein